MPVEPKTITDADVMTGFNPAYGTTAEEIENGAAIDADGTVSGAEAAPEKVEAGVTSPAEVEVNLDGRKLKAPRELAEAFTREINRRDGTRGAELQQLRERLARVEGVASAVATRTEPEKEVPAGPQLPNPELAIENPAAYQAQMIEYVEHRQKVQLEAVATQYTEAEQAKTREGERIAAWNAHCDAFYARPENKILRENRDIVDTVLKTHADTLAPLSVEDGFVELGRLARERIAKITGVAPEARARAQKPPVLEGSQRRDSAVTPPAEDNTPTSLTAVLKERRRLAADAFNKGSRGQPGASR